MASAFNAFLAAMWIERNIRGATLHRKQKQKQMKKNKMLSDAKKVLYLVLMFACSGPAYAGIRSRKQNCWSGILWYDILNSSLVCHLPMWRAYALAPLHIYHWFVGDAVMDSVVYILFFAANCRGVSHTPWCGRKRKDGGEQSIVIPWKSPLPDLFAYVEGVCPCAPT